MTGAHVVLTPDATTLAEVTITLAPEELGVIVAALKRTQREVRMAPHRALIVADLIDQLMDTTT